MIQQNPPYNQVMKDLGINVFTEEKSPICNSKLVNPEKEGKTEIKTKNLKGFSCSKSELTFLRYRQGFYFIKKTPLSHKTEKKEGFTHK